MLAYIYGSVLQYLTASSFFGEFFFKAIYILIFMIYFLLTSVYISTFFLQVCLKHLC